MSSLLPQEELDSGSKALRDLFNELPYNPVLGTREIAKVDAPLNPMTIEEWRQVIRENFPEFEKAAEACLSVVCQLIIQDVRNPFPLVLVDRASSGKTIVLNFFADFEGITFTLDQFTPASFVSHIAGRTKKQLAEIDLLPSIKNKVLIVREMGTIFGENDDALRQKMGLLTRVFDGEGYRDWSGVHGKRGYSGDYNFMFLGASTPFPLRVWKTMTQFGHRFHFMNLGTKKKGVTELMATHQSTNYKVKQELCRKATAELIKTLWHKAQHAITWDKGRDEPEAMEWIANMAIFVASFRGDIIVYEEWGEKGKEITANSPAIEDPSRLFSCLCNLASGHAVACGRNYITMDDLEPVIRVALSTAPAPRPELFTALLQAGGKINAQQISKALNISLKTAKKEMYKFIKIGVATGEVEREQEEDDAGAFIPVGQGKNTLEIHPEFSWWTSEVMLALLDKFKIIR